MTAEETLAAATRLLVEAVAPLKIILFGSHARGEAHALSDLDLLVVLPTVVSRRRETARLLALLARHRIRADVVVTSASFFATWRDVPGTVLYEAAREGKVVYEAA
jgi:predicted nucleotidyltransferase